MPLYRLTVVHFRIKICLGSPCVSYLKATVFFSMIMASHWSTAASPHETGQPCQQLQLTILNDVHMLLVCLCCLFMEAVADCRWLCDCSRHLASVMSWDTLCHMQPPHLLTDVVLMCWKLCKCQNTAAAGMNAQGRGSGWT